MKNFIEFIEIQGFQSHIDTRINFSENMTAFTGLSMDGKTAIMRAFEFVRKNRPAGFKFNYRYEDIDTRVSIGVCGHIVTHMKSIRALNKEGHKALYIITYPNGSTKEISAFGTNVPDDVAELLNISDISMQSQLDPYMLILSTTGQIANTINKITGIDVSDNWVKKITKALGALKAEKTVLENSQKSLATDIASYDGIDDVRDKILKAQELDWEYAKIIQDANAILDLVNVNSGAELKIGAINGQLTGLQTLMNRLANVDGKLAGINDALAMLVDYKVSANGLRVLTEQYEVLYPKISLIESCEREIKNAKDWIEFRDFYFNQKLMLETCQSELDNEKDNLTNLLIEAGVCHLCGSELKDKGKIREAI